MEFGLENSDIQKIKAILASYPEIEQAVLYGSRAKGNFQEASDIDIVLIGRNLNLTIQQKAENDLDDLMLPLRFDVSIYHHINNEALIEHIKRVGKLLYEKTN